MHVACLASVANCLVKYLCSTIVIPAKAGTQNIEPFENTGFPLSRTIVRNKLLTRFRSCGDCDRVRISEHAVNTSLYARRRLPCRRRSRNPYPTPAFNPTVVLLFKKNNLLNSTAVSLKNWLRRCFCRPSPAGTRVSSVHGRIHRVSAKAPPEAIRLRPWKIVKPSLYTLMFPLYLAITDLKHLSIDLFRKVVRESGNDDNSVTAIPG